MHLDCGQKDMIEPSFAREANFHSASSSNSSRSKSALWLLTRREICPKSKHVPRRQWGGVSQCHTDAKRGLASWAEADSLNHLLAKYCSLVPPPRSTIAAAFSPDGKMLASTHGDHTVKIIDFRTGKCMKVLSGHRRTPWVVRFHPMHSEILASGSLDYEVRLWDAKTAECIGSRDFYRPIASIAFHPEGELLAVASGHKLYIWQYNKTGESCLPIIVLKTRRSLRAVHFHPHAAPYILTAEVSDLDSDSPLAWATSPGYLRYPPPAVFIANVQSSDRGNLASDIHLMPSMLDINRLGGTTIMEVDSSGPRTFHREANAEVEYGILVSPMDIYPSASSSSYPAADGRLNRTILSELAAETSAVPDDAMEIDEVMPSQGIQQINSNNLLYPLLLSRHPTWWELPFLQGWLMGQGQTGFSSMSQIVGNIHENSAQDVSSSTPIYFSNNTETVPLASSSIPSASNITGVPVRGSSRHRGASRSRFYVPETGENRTVNTIHGEGADSQPILNRIHSEIATSLAAATNATAELPCTVKLRVWSYDIEHPFAPFSAEQCRLTIPHAVLCSEMGAHFSPCGRYLAACVACMLPIVETDPASQSFRAHETGVSTSPTRHPISTHQVMYELRIYSMEEATFGTVLVSRAIRAAHCLTSIQFSPTSEHILLAYGRRHGSLLKSIVIDGETTSPFYTVLEVYRVSDMELVKILPSAEDEVNVACFHPFPGSGLVYGTKEGKLRILQFDGAHGPKSMTPNFYYNLSEIQTYALEG